MSGFPADEVTKEVIVRAFAISSGLIIKLGLGWVSLNKSFILGLFSLTGVGVGVMDDVTSEALYGDG